jgi:hypothetical protein
MYRIKPFSFLAWWLASSVLVWPLSVVALGAVFFPLGMAYSLFRPYDYDSQNSYNMLGQILMMPIMGAVTGFMMSSVQHWLLRSRLYWAADGWRLWSLVGGAVGGFVLYIIFQSNSSYGYNNSPSPFNLNGTGQLLAMPVFLAFVSGCQMLPLRHAVKHPWLWFVANVAAGVAFVGILINNHPVYGSNYSSNQLGLIALSLATLGLVTGFAVLHLFERHLLPMNPEGMEHLPSKTSNSVWDDAV